MNNHKETAPAVPVRKVYETPAIAWEESVEINQFGSSYSYCSSNTQDCTSEPKAPC